MELLERYCGVFFVFFVAGLSDFPAGGQSIVESAQNTITKNVEKPRTLYDYQTRVVAYKDLIESKCVLEILTNEESIISQTLANRSDNTIKHLSNQLSKREIWRLAGTRISDFCRGFPTYLVQNNLQNAHHQDFRHMQNDLPIVEISSRSRRRRDTTSRRFAGVRSQTQSQYLNFGNGGGQPGKAEAESSYEGTKAVVSGTSGMGQAQSQSSPVDCGECLGAGFQDQSLHYSQWPIRGQSPEKFTRPGGYPEGPADGAARPGEGYPPGGQVPGYPGRPGEGVPPGTGRPGEAGTGYPPGAGRPGEAGTGYPTGAGRPPGEIGTGSPPSTRRPGEYGAGYPPGTGKPGDGGIARPAEGGAEYPPAAGKPGEGGAGYPSGAARPSEGGIGYPPAAARPSEGGTGIGRPGEGGIGRPGEGGEGYPPGATRPPGGISYPPGAGRPGEGVAVYPPGPGRPGELGTIYPPGAGRPGTSVGYPPGTGRPGEGGAISYPAGAGRPGEGGAGYPSPGTARPGEGDRGYPPAAARPEEGTARPGGGPSYPPGPGRPGEGGIVHPPGTARPGEGGVSYPPGAGRPGEGGAGYPPTGFGRPGGGISYPPGVRPGEAEAGYPPSGTGYPSTGGTFGGQLSGQYDAQAGHSGRFSGTFQGTYESGAGAVGPGYAGGQYGGPGGYPGGPAPPPGSYVGPGGYGGYGPPGGGPGTAVGPSGGGWQLIDGKWVPSGVTGPGTGVGPSPDGGVGTGGGQWINGHWVPSGGPGTGAGAGTGQWVDGKWVPSGGPDGTGGSAGAGTGQWVDGRWVPAGGPGTGAGTGTGQWVDGKWVPSGGPGSGAGAGAGAGQWVDGKWVPSGGPETSGGDGTGTGQWINGKWVPSGGPGPGAGAGQWVDGKWVPSGGPGTGPGQWVNGQWVPSGASGPAIAGGQPPAGYPSGTGYPSGGPTPGTPGYGGQPPAGAPPYGPGGPGYGAGPSGAFVPPGQYVQPGPGAGQWVDGKWVPSGGTATGAGAGGGQWVDGKWVPSGAAEGGAPDDADSQVKTSVQQTNNETIASAQAQGRFQSGTAQSQVSGTYSGSGSFSASAGSDDGKKGALTHVSGGKQGAQSSAQGRGGAGSSQAEVSLDSETGDTLSSAQTQGVQHGTQTKVRASEKGGLADAQANGLGATSSQAQIGFTPHDENERDNQTSPFGGGGTAAAQSGTHSGMTQTEIQGKFRYGIRYQGAAQAASGSTAIRNLTEPTGFFKPINFTATRVSHDRQSQSQQASVKVPVTEKQPDLAPQETLAPSGSTREVQKIEPISREEPVVVASPSAEPGATPSDYDDPDYADQEYDEEVSREEDPVPVISPGPPAKRNLVLPGLPSRAMAVPSRKPASVVSQSSDHQKQHMVLDPLENLDATVHQSKGDFPPVVDGMVLQPGQVIPGSPGYQIPAGFRGKVKSIANGPNTYAIGKHAQAQSVTLSPGSGRIFYNNNNKPGANPVYGVITRTSYKNGNYGSGYSYQPIYHPVGFRVKSGKVLPNFVSVSKSEAGSTNLNTGKKTPDVYYTQSSSCGMFTNSCFYTNGRKTCFPVRKTNPDGSPMSC